MAKIVWAEAAIDDLTNIAEYCSSYSEKHASSIVSRLFNKVNILKTMPKIGRVVNHYSPLSSGEGLGEV